MHIKSEKIINLENKIFEEYFTVFGYDENEIRYILTPALMEKIINIKHKFNENISISFYDNNIHIAIPKTINFNENIMNVGVLSQNYELIFNIVSIIEDLDLNTRIWSKE